jgi:heme exporter protein B
LFNVRFSGQLPGILLTFFLGSLGIATAGTALAAISTQAKMRDLLLPVLLLPVLAPILIASTEVTIGLMSPEPFMQWKGIGFLAVFDVVFLTALWLFGEYLLEE